MKPQYDPEGWPWQPNLCPADQQLIEYLNDRNSEGKILFHMGTGLHHMVGIEATRLKMPCIGLTVSSEEYAVSAHYVSPFYQVMFGDINKLDPRLLPTLDYATLFHFGEMAGYFGEIDEDVLLGIIFRLKIYGKIIFYTGSSAWDRVLPVLTKFVDREKIILIEAHKDLWIYRGW